MAINLRAELVALLESEGLGRVGYLRKTRQGSGKQSPGGEYDPQDNTLSAGRPYLDYEIRYYKTEVMASELKTTTGTTMFMDEVIYIAADADVPAPGKRDSLVEIQHSIDGVPDDPHLIANIIPINSVIEHWSDNAGATVYYAISSTRRRTGERGVA